MKRRPELFFIILTCIKLLFIFCVRFFATVVEHYVCKYAEDKSACNRGHCNFAEADCHATDTSNQYDRDGEQILVVAEVNGLYHFKTGNRDESVKCYAHAAHYAVGNGGEEGHKGSYEGSCYSHDSSYENCYHRGVARDSDATD